MLLAAYPVKHHLYFAWSSHAAIAAFVFLFLMFCASSGRMSAIQNVNYLPMTTLSHFTSNSALPPLFVLTFGFNFFLVCLMNESSESESESATETSADTGTGVPVPLFGVWYSEAKVWKVVTTTS